MSGTPDRCFAPIARRDATRLILGSLPGRKSLEMQQYYAHPQNAFWRLIFAVLEVEGPLTYAGRLRLLEQNRIAVWDVLEAAERPGSLDSSIVHASMRVNDFEKFFRGHPRIRRVFFNGRKSEALFRRFALPKIAAEFPDIRFESLPSSSPAHAGMTFAKKLGRWKKLKEQRT